MATTVVQQADLARGVALACSFVEEKSTLQILTNILVRPGIGGFTVCGTDLETRIEVPIKADSISPDLGLFCAPGHKLNHWLQLVPKEPLELDVNDRQFLTARHKRGHARMAGLQPDSFPNAPDGPWREVGSFKLIDLVAGLRRADPAVPSKLGKYTVPATLMEISQEGVALIGTDGHRLSWQLIPMNLDGGEHFVGKITLSIDAAKAIALVSKVSDSETILIETSSSDYYRISSIDGYVIYSRRVDGNFPDFRKVMKEAFLAEVVVSRLEFLAALKRASTSSPHEGMKVAIGFEPDALTVSGAVVDLAEADDAIQAEHNAAGDPPICFNASYLSDWLSSSDADKVVFRLNGPSGTAELGEVGNPNWRYVVMPMRA